jgi:hypothetical protein
MEKWTGRKKGKGKEKKGRLQVVRVNENVEEN